MSHETPETTEGNCKAIGRLDEEWRLMNAALEQLGKVEAEEQARALCSGLSAESRARAARLIFGLDLTASREAGLREARIATAAMFDAIKAIGSVAVKLAYYRATEFRHGKWQNDPAAVRQEMLKLSCKLGGTQIEGLLRLVLAEKDRVSGLIFIGDDCEEYAGTLVRLAEELGARKIPIFMFHECSGHHMDWIEAKPTFQRMAEASGGAYCELTRASEAALRELLTAVAAFSAAGHSGLKQIGQPVTPEGRQLRRNLLLLSDGSPGSLDQSRQDGKTNP